jgi:hypothetical protein
VGAGRWARYSAPDAAPAPAQAGAAADEAAVPLSPESQKIRAYLRQPLSARKSVGYNREFLNAYRPGKTFYLPEGARARLAEIGERPVSGQEPAGTYARRILNRLLIDLSWNSSRLEGNTYSLLDTKRLIEFGQEADGRDRLEAQMILNHKDAVEFLVGNAAEIGFNRYTILNLHAILANNLLADERAAGRLRHIGVGIDGSVYHPPETPQLVEECFDQLLATAAVRTSRSSEPTFRPSPSRIYRAACTCTPFSGSTNSTGSNFSGTCSSGRTNVRLSVMPPCGSRSASPTPSGCVIETRCALWSRRLCKAAGTERRLLPTSNHGRRRISTRTTGRRFVRSPRTNCWVFTRATSRAIRSGQRSLRHGRKSGVRAARDASRAFTVSLRHFDEVSSSARNDRKDANLASGFVHRHDRTLQQLGFVRSDCRDDGVFQVRWQHVMSTHLNHARADRSRQCQHGAKVQIMCEHDVSVFACPGHNGAVRGSGIADCRPMNRRPAVIREDVNSGRRQADVDDEPDHCPIGTSVSSTRHAA